MNQCCCFSIVVDIFFNKGNLTPGYLVTCRSLLLIMSDGSCGVYIIKNDAKGKDYSDIIMIAGNLTS